MEKLHRLLSEQPCVNYKAFSELVKKAVENVWGDSVLFYPAYPHEDVDITPIITHNIRLKEPGGTGTHREIKPRLRYSDKTEDGRLFNVYGQWFDFEVQFDIWAGTGDQADQYVEDFQQLIMQYTGFFKRKGVSQIFLKRQVNDNNTKQWRSDLINRTLVYYVKIDETRIIFPRELKTVDINPIVAPYLIIDEEPENED